MANGRGADFDSRDFRHLIAWQKAQSLAVKVFDITKQLPSQEKYGIISQMTRCASSIAANLAEGNGSCFPRKTLSFYSIARGSADELRSWLDLCLRLDFINQKVHDELDEATQEVIRLIIALIRKVQNEINHTSPAPRSHKRTLDKQKLSPYSGTKQEGSKVNDDDFEFEVAVLQWIEQSKSERVELMRKEDQLRMMTNDEGRFLPDVPREEGQRRYRGRK
ncbi:four helix bundle protein [Alicyclobacillus acidiphilus]|uniref:four helix bundle protein n=1 Tax=Alicyclobacillus acidiphilus TaxID=182455 RepID=UPI00082FBB2F|nr:four helix bundle protein [Alicyclobacillus acidiphilus]